MIVNKKYNFVFVHVPKTAGSSVDAALRHVDGSRRVPGTKHHTYADFQEKLSWYQFSQKKLRVVGFVRNPWGRLLSLHRYLLLKGRIEETPSEFSDFVASLRARESWVEKLHSVKKQSDYLPENAFYVGRFEALESDFDELTRKLAVRTALPHLNSSGGIEDYREKYCDDDAEFVALRYEEDIRRFAYSF